MTAIQLSRVTIDDPTAVSAAQQNYNLTDEQLNYATDPNEQTHVEYDTASETFLLVFNLPVSENQDELQPMTFMLKNNHLLVFVNQQMTPFLKQLEDLATKESTSSPNLFLMDALFLITEQFMPLADKISSDRHKIKISQKGGNKARKNLLAIARLENRALLMSTAARQNAIVLRQLQGLPIYHNFSDAETERLGDVLIEADQLVEMIGLTKENLSQMHDTVSDLMNDNLNDTMKFLTIWSLLLTVPGIVSGFFGMNFRVPFETNANAWLYSLVLMAVLMLAMSWYIRWRNK